MTGPLQDLTLAQKQAISEYRCQFATEPFYWKDLQRCYEDWRAQRMGAFGFYDDLRRLTRGYPQLLEVLADAFLDPCEMRSGPSKLSSGANLESLVYRQLEKKLPMIEDEFESISLTDESSPAATPMLGHFESPSSSDNTPLRTPDQVRFNDRTSAAEAFLRRVRYRFAFEPEVLDEFEELFDKQPLNTGPSTTISVATAQKDYDHLICMLQDEPLLLVAFQHLDSMQAVTPIHFAKISARPCIIRRISTPLLW